MAKYCPTYKCMLCNAYIYGSQFEAEYDDLPKLLVEVVRNQQMISNPILYKSPMQIPHKCKFNDAGMAYFAGFSKA